MLDVTVGRHSLKEASLSFIIQFNFYTTMTKLTETAAAVVVIYVSLTTLAVPSLADSTEFVVKLNQGTIRGKGDESSRNGRKFIQFLGIPYAKKPERFQVAGPEAPPWDGIRDGSKFGSPCAQFDRSTRDVTGKEDCLFLNVYTPVTKASNVTKDNFVSPKKPVIVHIHGGSFVSQSSDQFGATYFMDEDVVLVTFNYRLSVFGFLSTGDSNTVANLGLRDQIQALKWVHLNIGHFGGDPSKVTLFGGGSAGGAMASYLMLSPMAKGLFSGVISSSGNALSPWAIVHHPRKIVEKLAAKLNCPLPKGTNNNNSNNTMKGAVDCIKGKSVKDIEIARISLQGFAEDPAVPFAPVVESWLTGTSQPPPVIPENPAQLMAEGRYNRVPWLSGVNSLNGVNLGVASILTTPKRLLQLNGEWEKLAPLLFHYSQTSPNAKNVSAVLRQHYFGNKSVDFATREKLIASLTDRNFISCTSTAASLQSKHSPVYLYNLEYMGPFSFLDEWGVKDKLNVSGVVHGDELQFLFPQKPPIKKGDKHASFSAKLVSLWTTFAEMGKPMEMGDTKGADWSPLPPNTGKHGIQWYSLISSRVMSQPTIFDGQRQSTIWDEVELGEYKPSSDNKSGPKFAIGYEMKSSSPSPITKAPSSTSKSPTTAKIGGSLVLQDDNPYSSTTTTTTTKKPGFFQKIIGR